MFRKLVGVCVVLVAVSVLFAGGGGRTILVDDFDDGDDDEWSHADFTPNQSGVFDARSGALLIESDEPIPATDPNAGVVVATWEPSRDRRQYSNGVARVRLRANTRDTTCGVLLRANDEIHVDYGFFASASFGTFYIEQFDGSRDAPQAIIAIGDPNEAPFAHGEEWNLEGGVVGHNDWLKAWRVGDSEPDEPLLMVEDREVGPQDGSLICLITQFDPAAFDVDDMVEISATFDDVIFTRGADPLTQAGLKQ